VHFKKHLSFSALREALSDQFAKVADWRQSEKVDYSLHDCLMSGFAMMLFQDPSLLCFQQRMQDSIQNNNLHTMFKVDAVAKESQMRSNLDQVCPQDIEPVFNDYISRLQRGKQLSQYQFLGGYLVPLDGSQYFSSKAIHCPSCLTESSKGKIRYSHKILQAAIVCPGKRQVLPLAPEFITNRDGTKKQDCEINAAKRWIPKFRRAHPKLNIIITGDDLFSKQPFIDEVKRAGMSYILVAKPDDHKVLFQWVNELTGLGGGDSLEIIGFDGKRHCYQWINQVPLNGTKGADEVNFFQYQIVSDNKVTYSNSWVTDIAVEKSNVVDLVKGGRARWKIENEVFNTLKNQGYHIEHNYGHGEKNLSSIFFLLNLLAFFVHQILDLTDTLYQTVRYKKFTSRKEYFNQLRCTIRILIFRSWEHMLGYILDPPMYEPP
jgi:hypothetical protein